jgi:hypothetical protein
MKKVLFEKDEVAKMITAGKKLILASDEKNLKDLPSGSWIAGTIPYFMGENGGVSSHDQLFVTELPDFVMDAEVKVYDETNIHQVYEDSPRHGYSVIIIPASCNTHFTFALKAPGFSGFATRPLIGWIAGVDLDDSKNTPKIFDGTHSRIIENGAVVMHVTLPPNKLAYIDIVNIFEQGDGDTITFPEDGFSATTVLINGHSKNLADYILENSVDTRLLLVTNLYGAMINTSFKSMDFAKKEVTFYAPVFAGLRYKIAKPVDDYSISFMKDVPDGGEENVYFACNCILNFLYAGLEGKKTGKFTGPITFGEIAYQLMNQTLAYLTIQDI